MAKANTGTKKTVITNQPVQTTQTIKVRPNGNIVIVEKDKSVVPTVTTKDRVKTDASGTPIADVTVTKTVKDKTTVVTKTVINKQGEIVKQNVDVKQSQNVVKVKTVTPYTSPDAGLQITNPVGQVNNPGQSKQVISRPAVSNSGLVVPPIEEEDEYIDVGSIASTANGALISQTWRSPRDGYVTKLRFYLSDVGAAGDMKVYLGATRQTGEPDLSQVISSATVEYANLKTGWNDITLEPAFVQKGKLYNFTFQSVGAHSFLMAVGGNLSQGTFFTSQDEAWFKGELDVDLALQIYFAEFKEQQVITTMEPLTLEGGIGAMYARIFEIEPEGTSRVLQGRINGTWTDLAADGIEYPFTNLPALIELRQVLSGTKELMPATNHGISRVITYRLRTDFKAVSNLIDAGTDVTSAKVRLILHRFNDVDHDCVIKLLDEGDTPIAAAAVSDALTDDPLIIERTATFTFSEMQKFRILVEGQTNSSLNPFWISEILYSASE